MILEYITLRVRRSIWRCTILVLIAFGFSIFLNLIGNVAQQHGKELDRLYNETDVIGVVSNAKGTAINALHIGDTYIKASLSGPLSSYIRDVAFVRELDYALSIEEVEDKLLKKEELPNLVGITYTYGYDALSPEKGIRLEYFEGYDESIFLDDDYICLINETLWEESMETIDLYLRDNSLPTPTKSIMETFRIVGLVKGYTGGMILCPWNVIDELGQLSNGVEYTQSLRFKARDNRELDALKTEAAKLFVEIDRTNSSKRGYALTIHDGTFLQSVASVSRNIKLVEVIAPLMFTLAIGIGFISGLLFTRSRKPEFAVMRSLGQSRNSVFSTALLEQIMLGVSGTFLSIIVLILSGLPFHPLYTLIFLVCYSVGTAVSVLRIASLNVMAILTAKE